MTWPGASVRAAQYLRMSTDHQPNSPANQAAAIEAYALLRGYEVVRTYEDAGASGLSARGRPAFQAMLQAVLSGQADFEVILAYDVSRFGRFQDPDEAAHYEWLCRSEGVCVEYCVDGLSSGGLEGALLKGVRRAMAAEFSRELGQKVRDAQRRLAGQGHWQHGRPGYGLRRRIVGADGALGRTLENGERKIDPHQHTILVAGPRQDVALVREIFACCAQEAAAPAAIARRLNAAGRLGPNGDPWSARKVREILTNPKYAGVLVTHRRHTPLGGRTRQAPPEDWVRSTRGAPKIVPRRMFEAVQAVLERQRPPTNEALLAALRSLAARHGVLSEPKLAALGARSYRSYRRRFGSLRGAYEAIGYAQPKHHPKQMDDRAMLQGLADLFHRTGDLTGKLIDDDSLIPSADHYRTRFGSLAHAYAAVGFVRLSKADLKTPVGRARQAARALRMANWGRAGRICR
jgi:DNA invertase Pin-like site-specific DNA recombinase